MSLVDTPEVTMRNPIHFAAAIRNLVVLANVAILAAERFAAVPKPVMSRLCLIGTSRDARQWYRRGHSDAAGERYCHAISPIRHAGQGDLGTGYEPMPTRRCDCRRG